MTSAEFFVQESQDMIPIIKDIAEETAKMIAGVSESILPFANLKHI